MLFQSPFNAMAANRSQSRYPSTPPIISYVILDKTGWLGMGYRHYGTEWWRWFEFLYTEMTKKNYRICKLRKKGNDIREKGSKSWGEQKKVRMGKRVLNECQITGPKDLYIHFQSISERHERLLKSDINTNHTRKTYDA